MIDDMKGNTMIARIKPAVSTPMPTGEQDANPRDLPEGIDDRRLDVLLNKRREYKQAPNAVDDDGDGREQLNHRGERPFQPDRADFSDEHRHAERHRYADHHGNCRGDQSSIDRCEGTELFGYRVPDVGIQ